MGSATAKGTAVEAGGSVSPTNFWTYRNFNGNVQARVTDISRTDGTAWQYGSLRVEFIDQSGVVHMSKTLSKTWGVPPGWTVVGSPVTNPYLRLRIGVTTLPGGYAGQTSNFTLELRW